MQPVEVTEPNPAQVRRTETDRPQRGPTALNLTQPNPTEINLQRAAASQPNPHGKGRNQQDGRPISVPPASRPAAPRHEADEVVNLGPRTPSRLQIEPILESDRPSRPSAPAPRPDRPYSGRSGPGRSSAGYSGAGRSSSSRPFRGEGGLARPFYHQQRQTPRRRRTSQQQTRKICPRPLVWRRTEPRLCPAYHRSSNRIRLPAGSRPKALIWRPIHRFQAPGAGPRPSGSSRPFTPREGSASESRPRSSKPYPNSASRAERQRGTGWKPKTRYGGSGKPASGAARNPAALQIRLQRQTLRPQTVRRSRRKEAPLRNRRLALPESQVPCFSRQPSAKRATMLPIHHCFARAT